ncbi:MAG: DUF4399 domain-containing protein [Mariprofundaceae bacterium]|nr:DUF4399 domain-containing protein [Mariprofundaceae bacterium]
MKQWSFTICAALALAVLPLAGVAHAGETHSVAFEKPHNGAQVKSEFKVEMEVDGMKVHKAGDIIDDTGHHHLIIDGDCIAKGQVVPKDATHLHFGKGQTETMLKLAPGKHTLTLQFANGHHQSYGRELCTTIHVTVK